MVLGAHGGTGAGVFDFIFWPFKVNSAFWRGRALHSIVVTSPWPGEEHSREVANSNEKKKRGVWRVEGGLWMAGSGRESFSSPTFSDPVAQQHCSTENRACALK